VVARDVVFANQHEAIGGVHDLIERHDPEVAQRISLLSGEGALPNTAKSPDLYATYLAEAILVLAKRIDELESS
jgi:hypothetical protein